MSTDEPEDPDVPSFKTWDNEGNVSRTPIPPAASSDTSSEPTTSVDQADPGGEPHP
jgi:hypothetical protein